MPLANRRARPSIPSIVTVAILGLAAVFILPFGIPVAPAVSDSYVFGFNNRAALLLFVLFAVGFAFWTHGLGLAAVDDEDVQAPPPMSRRLLGITLALTAAVAATFWLAYRGVGAINEGSYLMDRLQHLASGEVLYRDFEFIYGPLLLFIPLGLHRLLGLSLLDAYYGFWMLSWVFGVYALWLTVKWSCSSSRLKNGIYILAFLGFIFSTISLGLNYTPLRFVSAPFFAALCWRRLASNRSAWPAALLSLVGSAWTLFLSPEQGIAFSVGTLLFFLLFVTRSHRSAGLAIVILLLGQGTLFILLQHSGVVQYMSGMAQGGYNLPLLPSLNVLVELILFCVAICLLVNSLQRRRLGGPLEYLVLVSLCALPAAFGRCDVGHMFMNTVGAFIAAWTVLSYRRHAGRWMVASYVAGALILPLALYQANNFFMYPFKAALFAPGNPHPLLRTFSEATMHRVLGTSRSANMLAKWRAIYPVVTPSDAPRDRVLLAPLGYPSALLLAGLPPITNGRYRGLGNVMTSSEVQQKVDELRNHPQDLLLFTSGESCPREDVPTAPSAQTLKAEDHQARRELFLNLLPFYVPHVRNHLDLLAPVCHYITAHYKPSPYTAPLAGATILEYDTER